VYFTVGIHLKVGSGNQIVHVCVVQRKQVLAAVAISNRGVRFIPQLLAIRA
jgi:hypothetical protein